MLFEASPPYNIDFSSVASTIGGTSTCNLSTNIASTALSTNGFSCSSGSVISEPIG